MGYRHRKNPMPVSALFQWISVLAICGLVGFFYVYLKVQMVNKGREIKAIDAQIAQLRDGNDILRNQIDLYTSREYLLRQVGAGFIQLDPIPQERLVRLAEPNLDNMASVDFRVSPELAMP